MRAEITGNTEAKACALESQICVPYVMSLALQIQQVTFNADKGVTYVGGQYTRVTRQLDLRLYQRATLAHRQCHKYGGVRGE